MLIGIDASNIRTGGGLKHLEKFVQYTLEHLKNTSFVIVSNNKVNASFQKYSSVKCISNRLLNSNSLFSLVSQLVFSNYYFKSNQCDLVFAPGGIFLSRFKPFFTMSQNMLPFENSELNFFSFNKRLKFKLIKILQLISFRRSNGVIFLTDYARDKVKLHFNREINTTVIPHGIYQQKENSYNYNNDILEILYISDFLPYKHNLNVFEAVSELIDEGYNISLTLIGKKDRLQYSKMQKMLSVNLKLIDKIKIMGQIPNDKIQEYYQKTSLFLFASSCENLPFIILEALSYGLPIITSNKSPMKDLVYGDRILFDSYNKNDIKEVIKMNIDKQKLIEISRENYQLSKKYNWRDNIYNTIEFFTSNI